MRVIKFTKIDYTGVPFIDTAQLILSNFLELEDPRDLTLEEVENLVLSKKKFGENSKYATLKWINANFTRFKASTMLFGTNHPRYQSSWKKYEKFREKFYERYIKMLIEEMHNQYEKKNDNGNEFCEICGISAGQFNFSEKYIAIKAELYDEYEKKMKPEDNFASIGRYIFPLVGSMSSEAQIMGNMTKPFTICPRCLFMVNYLLFSAQMIEGKWALFHIGNLDHFYKLIQSLMEKIIRRIKTAPPGSPLENLGVKDKNKQMNLFDTLFRYFGMLELDLSNPENFLEATQIKNEFISVWKFSNSGQGADLEIQNLPNKFIRFLWLAHALDLEESIKKILLQEEKHKIHPLRRLYSTITSGHWYSFDKIHKIKEFEVDPFIPLLYGSVVLNLKSDYLQKILKIISRVHQKKIELKEILKGRNFIKLQIIIQGIIKDMIQQGELTSVNLENLFGYIPNSTQFSDTMSLINFLLELEIDLDTYSAYIKKIEQILTSNWMEFFDASTKDEDLKNDITQQEFLRFYLYIGKRIKTTYKEENKLSKFFNRQLSRLRLTWLPHIFSNLSFDYNDFDWVTYQNLFFLSSEITDYQGNYIIPKKYQVWYPFRTLLGFYLISWFSEEKDFDNAINNLSSERPKLNRKFTNNYMEKFQNLLEIFVRYRFSKRGRKNSLRYFTQVLKGQISEATFIDQMYSYLKELSNLEKPETFLGKIKFDDFSIFIENLEVIWENCYLNTIDHVDGKQNRIFLKLTLPNILRGVLSSYDKIVIQEENDQENELSDLSLKLDEDVDESEQFIDLDDGLS